MDTSATAKGFHHVVGEGVHQWGNAISNQKPWEFSRPFCGVIRDDKDIARYTVMHDKYGRFIVHSTKCTGKGMEGTLCTECKKVASSFYRRCRSAVEMRDQSKDFARTTKNKSVLTSPTLAKRKMESDKKVRKSLQNKVFCLKAKRQRKNGVRLQDGMTELFDETEKLAAQYFKQENITDDDVSKILFFESLKNARVAQQSGSKRVSHSPLMIPFCITLNQKLGKRHWEDLAKTFHLPSQSTLAKHKSVGSNDPDGKIVVTCFPGRRAAKRLGHEFRGRVTSSNPIPTRVQRTVARVGLP